MADLKHTPGPWSISGISMNDGSISIRHDEHRIVIACVTNAASLGDFVAAAVRGRRDFGAPDTAQTQWANAHLIAAAPELLEALRLHVEFEAVPQDRGGKNGPKGRAWTAFIAARDAAIAKAEGGNNAG